MGSEEDFSIRRKGQTGSTLPAKQRSCGISDSGGVRWFLGISGGDFQTVIVRQERNPVVLGKKAENIGEGAFRLTNRDP